MKEYPEEQSKDWALGTKLVRGGTRRSEFGETSEALFLTSGFVYDTAAEAEARFKGEAEGFVYSRYGNPTVEMLQQRLAMLEGAEACRATASGMAAVFATFMSQLRAGDHVVASRAMFGACLYIVRELLPRYGVETTTVDGTDLDAWRAALRPNTRCVLMESPANPTLEILDIAAISALAHEVGARVIVDNVFATPVLQRPLQLGADIVIYSATKHIDGQGRCLGGAILGPQSFLDDELTPFLRNTGPAISPFNAWVLLKGLETLDLRLERMCQTAGAVAEHLSGHAEVISVRYPGAENHPQRALAARQMDLPGSIVTFEPDGGKAAAFELLDSLRLIDISNNLGDAKSLITHPASTTHQRLTEAERADLGITDALVRLSVGLEAESDLLADLDQALARIRP